MSKSVNQHCSDCDNVYTVRSLNVELIQFCPFCGTNVSLPTDDIDGDDEEFYEDE